ncbi:hypothetical protein [Shimia aestuarii]|uniref:hypothetical protein n=1 Tax=Shimia aestuarii TaxID=254406 RepID=UPI001FB1AD3A|nr:hypothetical protein [Shimia aestuarii]
MRNHYRKKLNKLLSRTGDEEFIQLLWATHILQTDNPDPALKFFLPETIPEGAISAKMPSKYSIHKWEIETLANELMTVPKAKLKRNRPIRKLRCDHFGAATDCVNWLPSWKTSNIVSRRNVKKYSSKWGASLRASSTGNVALLTFHSFTETPLFMARGLVPRNSRERTESR